MPIHAGMAVYKNKEEHKPHIQQIRTLDQGSNESRISLYSHAGTHVDAPYHMIADGYKTDDIPVHQMYGKCMVLDLTHIDDCIDLKDIRKYSFHKGGIVFLKTKNSLEDSFNNQYIHLSPEAARYMVKMGVSVVGIDGLSIERDNPDHDTHLILLQNDVLVVEGLRLKEVSEGEYTAVIAPLPVVAADGSPARVLLIRQ